MLNARPQPKDQSKSAETQSASLGNETAAETNVKVVYKFCDLSKQMVAEWQEHFKDYIPDRVQVRAGDIFKDGPAADAIVSPANSFGFMDGGIDMAFSLHFGWQLQERLQKVIREKHHGELLVGLAEIIPISEGRFKPECDWSKFNEGQPIKWLISAPTMRVPMDVAVTANAYLAFRAIILAVQEHNSTPGCDPIRSVLCPGLGTAVGRMPAYKCAYQMLQAFETYDLHIHNEKIHPNCLELVWNDAEIMATMRQAFDTFDIGLKETSFRLHPKMLKDVLSDHVHLMRFGDKEHLKKIKPVFGVKGTEKEKSPSNAGSEKAQFESRGTAESKEVESLLGRMPDVPSSDVNENGSKRTVEEV